MFDRFETDGWLRIGGVFDRALIDELRAEYLRQFDGLVQRENDHRGYIRVGDKRMMLSVRLTGPFLDPRLYANPLLIMVMKRFLGSNILIDSFTCVTALAGAADQEHHSDHPGLFEERPDLSAEMPPFAITVAIPLIDLSEETGTTKVFPGSHKREQDKEFELPFVSRGDCYLMDYRLFHHGTANRSPAQRPILYIIYARSWFTDIVNFRRQARLNIGRDALTEVPAEHHPLFRRVATRGGIDLSQKQLFPTVTRTGTSRAPHSPQTK